MATVALHLILLRDAFRFPHISSDEVQYAMTGESIRMGHGFTLRGQFNSTLPPVFPAFIALAHSAGPDPRLGMFILGCFVMCSAVFPVFAMARTCGLDDATAMVLAASAAMLPHTLYAATYMPETVQYPAYLTAFWLCLCWLENQTLLRDVATGGATGFLLLTKIQGTQFAAAFLLTLIVIGIHRYRSERRDARKFLGHTAIVLAVIGVIYGAWQTYKLAHAGTILGNYGAVVASQGLHYWTPKLALAYVADFLLAPGLITSVPLFFWIRHNGSHARTVFVLALFAVQVLAVSTFDGGLTGWLRERLYLYAFPITAVLAARGIVWFRQRQTVLSGATLIGLPLLLIVGVLTYSFEVSSVIEAPWANALGSLLGLISFSRFWLVAVAAAVSVLVTSALLRSSVRVASMVFGVFVLLFNVACFASSSVALADWTARGLAKLSPIIGWLTANGVHSGDRLLVVGRHAYFEDPSMVRTDSQDNRFLDWTWRLDLDETLEWQIETTGRFDVRMIPSPATVKDVGRPGDYMLTVARFDELTLKSFHYPLCLYRIAAEPTRQLKADYLLHVPAQQFRRLSSGEFGFDLPAMPRGTYQLSIDWTETPTEPFAIKVAGAHGMLPDRRSGAPSTGSIAFVNDAVQPLALLLQRGDPQFKFDGVDFLFVSVSMRPIAQSAATPPLHGEFSSTMPGELSGSLAKAGAACFVDLIDDLPPASSLEIERPQGVRMLGWAAMANTDPATDQVYVQLSSDTGARYWARASRYERPDVAQALGRPAWSQFGVSLSAGLGTAQAGRLHLKIILAREGRASECDPGRILVIR